MKSKTPAKRKKPKAVVPAKKPKKKSPIPLGLPDNRAAIALLDKWMKDDSGYDESVWPQIKVALEENRKGERKLFRD